MKYSSFLFFSFEFLLETAEKSFGGSNFFHQNSTMKAQNEHSTPSMHLMLSECLSLCDAIDLTAITIKDMWIAFDLSLG